MKSGPGATVSRIIGESNAINRRSRRRNASRKRKRRFCCWASRNRKEPFARAVHHLSARRDGLRRPQLRAIPETLIENELFGHERGAFTGAGERRPGKLELASSGTVFLDEIGELPLAVQGKLLRVIEEKVVDRIGGRAPVPVDVRVVAATNRDLKADVESGAFRRDLFFRLAVFPLEIPPLRDRENDIELLARYFAAELGKEPRPRGYLSIAAVAALRAHRWPGNVRELENAIERACILSDTMTLEANDLGLAAERPDDGAALRLFDLTGSLSDAAQRALRIVERRKILETLATNNGNKMQTAEDLGVSYKTLLTKIKDYNLG